MSVRAATADDLKRVVARGSRLTGGRISSVARVDGSYVFDILFAELVEPGADGELLPPLCNPPILDCTPDLTTLSYLHEPAVLYNLRRRYERKEIYTYSGVVLVAMNPFHPVALYSADDMARYARAAHHGDPHLFAIAEDAYRGMVNNKRNQTIIVYGESGSGKTTSAKYIMRYFAQAHHADTNDKQMSTVENQILATNPVFESFGNARTTRNDNSSRFGKFLDIKFERQRQRIVGGRIRTFLLERSRVVYQPPTERNYHIFYQLLAGAGPALRAALHLDGAHATADAFHYTRQGGPGSAAIPGVSDADDFAVSDASLEMVGIDSTRRGHIWRTLAGILHLGNVVFSGSESTGTFVEPQCEAHFALAADLLGVAESSLRQWLTRRQIVTRHDHILAKVNKTQALVIRDSIAKFVYSRLFDWILGPINASLLPTEVDELQTSFVGVLDIYGFEHFERNSFEQFCINYANEKLQQNFNHHVFKIEQEEYQREQLEDWTFIGFQDNQPCIDLIEGKPIGILALLDEESRLEQGSDRKFTEKLYRQLAPPLPPSQSQCQQQQQPTPSGPPPAASYFRKPRFSNSAFTVRHYAHEVTYEGDGFLEKNKDTVPDEVLDLLCTSSFEFVATLASSHAAAKDQPSPRAGGNNNSSNGNSGSSGPGALQRRQAPTLAGVFKRSLAGLMATLAETEMHYIRCIKPNETKEAWGFQAPMVLAQLRSCGVIETIRISKAGYPSRVPIRTFNERYAVLLGQGGPISPAHSQASTPTVPSPMVGGPKIDSATRADHALCRRILGACLPDQTQYQIGLTKVFFRAGQWAIMEKKRSFLFETSALVIQRFARGSLVRQGVRHMAAAARTIQQQFRRHQAAIQRRRARELRAVHTIENWWLAQCQRRQRRLEDQCARAIQARFRGHLARVRLWRRQGRVSPATGSRPGTASVTANGAGVCAPGPARTCASSRSNGRDSTTEGPGDMCELSDGSDTEPEGAPQPVRDSAQVIRDAVARLTLGTRVARTARPVRPAAIVGPLSTKTDSRPAPHSGFNDAARRRAAEARASLLAAGAAGRNAEAELLRGNGGGGGYSPALTSSGFARLPVLRHQQSVPAQQLHQRRAAAWATGGSSGGGASGRDSLTIGDDLYAIISEFSVVADGRYGEVDARSLRKKDPRVPKPAPQFVAQPPGPAAPSHDLYGAGLRALASASASDGGYSEARCYALPAESVSSTASTGGPPIARRGSRTSMSAVPEAAGPGDYGRHTAARARAWAARQKERMLHALSGEKSHRRPHSPGTDATGLRLTDPALLADLTAALPVPVSPGMRLHHQSHSATNVLAPAAIAGRLSKVPSTGHLR
ncbi:Myosin type-2 heavy chain 1 [Coemansia spiralis]|nr:Myosin type-2 heavy chain 1 [Coemansia spiralis]